MDGMRTVALKLEFGVTRNQIFERLVVFPFSPFFFPWVWVEEDNLSYAL